MPHKGPHFPWECLGGSQLIKTSKATALDVRSGFSALTCFMSVPQLPTDRINTKLISVGFLPLKHETS